MTSRLLGGVVDMSRDSILVRLSWCVAAAMLVGWWLSVGPPLNQPAAADMIATNGGFTLMTANTRDQRVNEESEVLYVLDHHRGIMLVYGLRDVQSKPYIEMLDGGLMEVLFERARSVTRQTSP